MNKVIQLCLCILLFASGSVQSEIANSNVTVGKAVFAVGETVTINHSAGLQNPKDRLIVAQAGMQTQNCDAFDFEVSRYLRGYHGSVDVDGLAEGQYEAALYAAGTFCRIGEAIQFTVGIEKPPAPLPGPSVVTDKEAYEEGEDVVISWTDINSNEWYLVHRAADYVGNSWCEVGGDYVEFGTPWGTGKQSYSLSRGEYVLQLYSKENCLVGEPAYFTVGDVEPEPQPTLTLNKEQFVAGEEVAVIWTNMDYVGRWFAVFEAGDYNENNGQCDNPGNIFKFGLMEDSFAEVYPGGFAEGEYVVQGFEKSGCYMGAPLRFSVIDDNGGVEPEPEVNTIEINFRELYQHRRNLGVSVNAKSKYGIKKVRLYIDGEWVRTEYAAPYQWGLANRNEKDKKLRHLKSGRKHRLEVVAIDNKGFKKSIIRNICIRR